MLGSVRKLVYKMGFSPKAGSIFYSPSLDLYRRAMDAHRNFEKLLELENGFVYTSVVQHNILLRTLEDLRYCPMCSWSLGTVFEGFTVAARKCPNHGRVFQFFPVPDGYRIIANFGGGIDASA